jgi:hypothetical protein
MGTDSYVTFTMFQLHNSQRQMKQENDRELLKAAAVTCPKSVQLRLYLGTNENHTVMVRITGSPTSVRGLRLANIPRGDAA